MFNSTNSVFVKPICDSLGFARGSFTFYRTIITLTATLIMPVFSPLVQKFGVKKMMFAAALALGVVSFGYSFATQLWHFYLLAVVNGLFFNGISFVSVGVLVSAWFHGKKGMATGIAYAGSGLGGAVMVPLVGSLIERTSWQWSFRFMGIVGILVLVPVIIFFVKNKPEDVGQQPLPRSVSEQKTSKAPARNYTLREAARTGKFWLLIVAFFLISFFAGATNTHSAPYFSDLGYTTTYVSFVVSVMMLFLTIGKILLGIVYDRFGILAGNLMLAFFSLGFPVFALLSSKPAFPWLYAAFVGMASCGASIPLTVLVFRYYGEKEFPAIFSFCTMVAMVALSLSVPVMGAVYDKTGSYRPVWLGFLFCSAVIAACLIAAEMRDRSELKKHE